MVDDRCIHIVAVLPGITLSFKSVSCGVSADGFTVVIKYLHYVSGIAAHTIEQILCVRFGDVDPIGVCEVEETIPAIIEVIDDISCAAIALPGVLINVIVLGDGEELRQCRHWGVVRVFC